MACSTGSSKFLVSVGKAMAFDTTCAGEQLMFVADTLINSTFTQEVQSSQVYGGPGSRLLYEFDYQKQITVTLEDAAFSPTYLALQNGTKLADELSAVYQRETVTFDDAGLATLKFAPVGEVQVGQGDGTFTTVLAADKNITVTSLAGQEAQVIYVTEKQNKEIVIDSTSFPKAMKLVLSVDVFDSNNKKVEEMQIIIPKFKPDGNFEMSLTHDGVATSTVTGRALDDCGKYAVVHFIPNEEGTNACTVTGLIAVPNPVELDSTEVGDSVTLVVREQFSDGSVGAPVDTTGLTITSGDDTIATVAGGVVTIGGTAVAGNSTNITVTNADGIEVVVPVSIV